MNTPKTEQQINAEKASRPRPDLVPPRAVEAAGRAFGVGARKHGLAGNGRGTYRVAGTEQADPNTHWASFFRHVLAYRRGERRDRDSGLSHLDHAIAQLSIIIDLTEDPPEPRTRTQRRERLIAQFEAALQRPSS